MRGSSLLTLGAILLDSWAVGQASFSEPTGLFSVSVKIPQSTANFDNGDIEFAIQAPANAGWTAVGIGGSMLGSLIFVLYPGPDGKNVTVSPRLGQGEVMPRFYPQTGIIMRDGSGVSNQQMTAIFTCQNCKRWEGGRLNVNSTTQNWIYAHNPGDNLRTTDTQATIDRHDDNGYGMFTMDMTQAVLPDDQASVPSVVTPGSSNNSSSSSGNLIAGGGFTGKKETYIIIHAVIMGITFVILFPFGAIMIRMLRHVIRRSFWFHIVIQLSSYCLAIAGLVLGIKASDTTKSHFIYTHQILGVIIIAFLFIQILLGYTHHVMFKMKGKRTLVSYSHIWFGRICIILGVVNGGLGLPLAKASTPAKAIYAGAVSLVAICWALSYAAVKFAEHALGVGKKEKTDETVGPTPTIYQPAVYEMKTSQPRSYPVPQSQPPVSYGHPNIYTASTQPETISLSNMQPESPSYQQPMPHSHI